MFKIFSLQLKKLRNQKKLSQSSFAEKIGVTQSAVGMWETGKREPDLTTLYNISQFFDVTVDYLLGLTPNDNTVHYSVNNTTASKVLTDVPRVSNFYYEKISELINVLVSNNYLSVEEKNKIEIEDCITFVDPVEQVREKLFNNLNHGYISFCSSKYIKLYIHEHKKQIYERYTSALEKILIDNVPIEIKKLSIENIDDLLLRISKNDIESLADDFSNNFIKKLEFEGSIIIINRLISQLNINGRYKVIDYIEDLFKIKDYKL